MLKITVEKRPELATLKLEGRLAGPWVNELERSWDELTLETPARGILVDLSEVIFIDSEGKDLLRRIYSHGAELHATRLMTKFIIDEIARGKDCSQRKEGKYELGI